MGRHRPQRPDVARRVEDAGAAAITIHGRTARQSYSGHADWDFVAEVAKVVRIPVFGSGDCIEPAQVVERLRGGVSGVYVGRGVLRNPWILAQAQDLLDGRAPRVVTMAERGRFLLDYMDLLLKQGEEEGEASVTSRRGRRRRRPAGARPRPLGHQQAARPLHLVLEGPRGRFAAAHRHQRRRLARPHPRHHRRVLLRRGRGARRRHAVMPMTPQSRVFVAGHRGLVGSAILRRLAAEGYAHVLTATREQLDLRDQAAVNYWFKANRPEFVFLVAGTVGGIMANATRPAEFIYDNMMIHATVVHAAHLFGVRKLLYLGSSCIYPRECPQPMPEAALLSGPLEPTNEPYAVAKIAGIKLCQAYRRQCGATSSRRCRPTSMDRTTTST